MGVFNTDLHSSPYGKDGEVKPGVDPTSIYDRGKPRGREYENGSITDAIASPTCHVLRITLMSTFCRMCSVNGVVVT